MTIFVCKTCGRAIKSEEKPVYCYADRVDTIENIGDADAVRMGLFSGDGDFTQESLHFEFPRDVRYHPFTGKPMSISPFGKLSLSEFQDRIMTIVRRVDHAV
jgi:hypothetical protein